jgi:hypothetical protein
LIGGHADGMPGSAQMPAEGEVGDDVAARTESEEGELYLFIPPKAANTLFLCSSSTCSKPAARS